jgi:putative protein kinase ArgK-like GTPase of G3E family
MIHERHAGKKDVPVIKTVATTKEGVSQLTEIINRQLESSRPRIPSLIYQRALRIAGRELLRRHNAQEMLGLIEENANDENFNIHRFVSEFLDKSN